jgi:hypothetical protein
MITHVLVQNAGTIGTPATFANPGAVTDGVIAAFNAKTGAGVNLANALAAGSEIFLVLGDDTEPVKTAPLKKESILVEKKAYAAPVKQSTAFTIPAGPTGGAFYNIKVRVIRALEGTDRTVDGAEPFPTTNFELKVAASEGAAAIIGRFMPLINRSDVQYPFEARSNKINTLTLTGTSGTANVTIDGTVYLATFATDLTTTAANFVTAHAAAILSAHGYTVTSSAADVIFTQTKGNAGDPTIANVSGNLAGSNVATQAATQLIIYAKAFRTIFVTAIDGFTSTITVTPYSEGSGYGQYVREMEEGTRGTYSDYYQETGLLGELSDGPEINATTTGNYLLYVVRVPNDQEDSINRSFKYSEIVLALGSAVSGSFDTFFGVS